MHMDTFVNGRQFFLMELISLEFVQAAHQGLAFLVMLLMHYLYVYQYNYLYFYKQNYTNTAQVDNFLIQSPYKNNLLSYNLMGICIQKTQQNIDSICQKRPEFQVDKSKPNTKSLSVWKITSDSCNALKWPYIFHSSSSYIVLVVSNNNQHIPILKQDRTNLELAEMLFGAQFLCLHMKYEKKLMLNNREYLLTIYSFYGDSEQDQLLARVRLTYYMDKLIKYMEFGAGSLCLTMLNQSQPIILKNDIKQFIDFQSEQYEQAHNHIFFKEQLFQVNSSIKQNLNEVKNFIFCNNFTHNSGKLPHIEIKQTEQNMKKKQKKGKDKEIDESLPFACEITQINIKGMNKAPKIEGGNIDQSNILFEELGIDGQMDEKEKLQEFLKGLYLSTQKTSKNFSLLNQMRIKLIINCAASTCKNWFINDIDYKWIQMPDPVQSTTKYFNIQCLIYQVADLAGKYLSEPSGVLIHCTGYNPKILYSGSRSVAILISLLMSSLKISYDDSLNLIKKKWQVILPTFLEKQFREFQKRKKQKSKGFQVYTICSYSKNYPKHLVAKYICEVQNVHNIQGIEGFSKSVFLCVSASAAKIMIGRQCENKQQYQKYAKEHLRLLSKYQNFKGQISSQPIQKTFRKQPKIEIQQQILHIDLNSPGKSAGFLRNEQIVLKYPILRPVWQKKKQDGFYFTIRQKGNEAEVVMNKGMNWIGNQENKQLFFDKLIATYLGHISSQKIFITESEQDKSIFDDQIM